LCTHPNRLATRLIAGGGGGEGGEGGDGKDGGDGGSVGGDGSSTVTLLCTPGPAATSRHGLCVHGAGALDGVVAVLLADSGGVVAAVT